MEACDCDWAAELGTHFRPLPWLSQERKRFGDEMHGDEVESIYVDDGQEDRFIVSFVMGFPDLKNISNAQEAAYYALDMTRDQDCYGTHWCVFDRQTRGFHMFQQYEFDTQAADLD